jgi:hypothetical protein
LAGPLWLCWSSLIRSPCGGTIRGARATGNTRSASDRKHPERERPETVRHNLGAIRAFAGSDCAAC